ncbi:hypothetical protein F511_01338 [Dorcoceras hygrometricum]|uniref:BHLH domain-containing protein n=1 Tax=Dorcoceras hygrometricum TaxID=472368 RepID=A0A2Z7D5X2_9LAMI|nr:hypothetical protein F511_01338 [Dorcoceras hygrometricum]
METLSKLFSCEDSIDQFLLHFNVTDIFSNNGQIPSNLLVDQLSDEALFFTNDTNLIQDSSNSSEIGSALSLKQSGHEFYNSGDFHQDGITSSTVDTYAMGYKIVPAFTDYMMEEILQLKSQTCNDQVGGAAIQDTLNGESCEEMQLKREYQRSQVQIIHQSGVDKFEDNPPKSPRKRSRVSKDAQKNKKNTQSKKKKKADQNNNDVEEENINGAVNGQSSSSCCSEDDSNVSQDLNEGSNSEAKTSKGKARASRGSATDPQSLYARRRRERINERLRILQNLVPNGTKVDISTMLEEAVHYVKFLQLQIKSVASLHVHSEESSKFYNIEIGILEILYRMIGAILHLK